MVTVTANSGRWCDEGKREKRQRRERKREKGIKEIKEKERRERRAGKACGSVLVSISVEKGRRKGRNGGCHINSLMIE